MKKKKIALLVLAIIIIIGVIIAICALSGKQEEKQETRLLAIYNNLIGSQKYLFTIEQNDQSKTIMAKNGDKTAIDTYSGNDHSTTIVKDGNTYLILHEREEYYTYQNNNIEQNILTDGLEELIDKEYVTGSEKINGKKYSYEEFNESTIFMISNDIPIDEEGIKTRFYFDKDNNLTYIRTIYDNNSELLKTSLSDNPDDSIFEIPENYAEN